MKLKMPASFHSENSITIPTISVGQIGILNVRPTSVGREGSQKPQNQILRKDDSV
jgi:hypothetical protein